MATLLREDQRFSDERTTDPSEHIIQKKIKRSRYINYWLCLRNKTKIVLVSKRKRLSNNNVPSQHNGSHRVTSRYIKRQPNGIKMNHRLHRNHLRTKNMTLTANAKRLELHSVEQLGSLTDKIEILHNLEELIIHGLQVTSLPIDIGNITNLKVLRLIYLYQIQSFPDSLGRLKNLKELSIHGSQMTCLPASIGNMTNLKIMHLTYIGKLQRLPDSIGRLNNLEELIIHESRLTSLPASIGDMTNLKKLYLCYMEQLRSLPDSIGRLTKLEEFNIYRSKMISLPESIGSMTNLKVLSLEFMDRLQSLPASIGRLINLKELTIRSLAIRSLPPSVGNMINLKRVHIDSPAAEMLYLSRARHRLFCRKFPASLWPLILNKTDRVSRSLSFVGDDCDYAGNSIFKSLTQSDVLFHILTLAIGTNDIINEREKKMCSTI